MEKIETWLQWAVELQSLAQAELFYNIFHNYLYFKM